VAEDVIDLMKKMIEVNPKKRIAIEEVLKHFGCEIG
jgi:hypothetical protein